MEKISRVVRGNARVASTDLKNAAPVRPGAPSFGRPIGESTAANPSTGTTAAKATAIQKELDDQKKTHAKTAIVQNMADSFFMNRLRAPDDEVRTAPADGEAPVHAAPVEDDGDDVSVEQPQGYKPRGSFVDVRA